MIKKSTIHILYNTRDINANKCEHVYIMIARSPTETPYIWKKASAIFYIIVMRERLQRSTTNPSKGE